MDILTYIIIPTIFSFDESRLHSEILSFKKWFNDISPLLGGALEPEGLSKKSSHGGAIWNYKNVCASSRKTCWRYGCVGTGRNLGSPAIDAFSAGKGVVGSLGSTVHPGGGSRVWLEI